MIIYYAAGGGLGHLTRARACLHTMGLKDRVALLTASPFAADKRVVGDTEIIEIPQSFSSDLQSYKVWLQEIFAQYQPAEIYMDTFPAGILGEFCDFEFPVNTTLIHLARLLKWEQYSRQLHGSTPKFALTYLLEPLTPDHEAWLKNQTDEIMPLLLQDPPHDLNDEMKKAAVAIMRSSVAELLVRHPQSRNQSPVVRRPLWLIVHSGASAETAELVAYAAEMSRLEEVNARLVLIAPETERDPQRQTADSLYQASDSEIGTCVEHFDFYPATAFFPLADRIITACGFNIMRQTEEYKQKHRFMPFERRFDNQFLRAARRKTSD
jgi:predicted glycosyltransferase